MSLPIQRRHKSGHKFRSRGKNPRYVLHLRLGGTRPSLDVLENRKVCCPAGNQAPDHPARRLVNILTATWRFQSVSNHISTITSKHYNYMFVSSLLKQQTNHTKNNYTGTRMIHKMPLPYRRNN